ncbi:MAG: ArsA family ATPase [Acidobacteria bacterium]|nr:ArsA family ATPase [Acidobacteriota bacterium]
MPIEIFLGTGGVGKTSVAAATALKAALAGSKCLVLTIDPARRLQTALGIDSNGLEQRVPLDLLEGKGELWAALLDVRASLDRAVLRYAKPQEAKTILEHPVYQILITSLAGMQELLAIERIHQALEDGFTSIVIDTAPSRHALEFLDKPEFFTHLVSTPLVKLVGRTYKLWMASPLTLISKMSFELYSRVEEILGTALVHQILEFFSIFRKIAEGYSDRAQQTLALLRDPHTTSFTIVTTPFKAKRDGEYFLHELKRRKFYVNSLVVNRLWPAYPGTLPPGFPSPLQELVGWYQNVCDAHQRAWQEVSRQFSGDIPKLIPLPELSRDVDGLPALYNIVEEMER